MSQPDDSETARVSMATLRDHKTQTVVLRDTLPPLSDGEIRLSVDAVGLSTNNVFYAQMGQAPFLKFASVYPVPGRKDLVHVPAWGLATVIASRNADVPLGRRVRGFLHFTNVVQLRARATADGFVADDAHRRGMVRAYSSFATVDASKGSAFTGAGDAAGLALASAPSALSGYMLFEQLAQHDFYGADTIAVSSASSKIALALATCLEHARSRGGAPRVVGFTSARHGDFVRATGLYDEVLTYDEKLPVGRGRRHVLVDVAGDAELFRNNEAALVKALAVGGTHGAKVRSTFTAFQPGALVKLAAELSGSSAFAGWADRTLAPRLEMFFAPTVMSELVKRDGRAGFDRRCDEELGRFAARMVDGGLIRVVRCESPEAAQAAYRRVFEGTVPPSEALLVALRA